MRFLKGKIDLDEPAEGALFEEALLAVRGGVRPTLSEWESLEEFEKRALVDARAVHEKELAIQTGIASMGRDALLFLASQVDGGEAKAKMLLDVAVEKAARRMNTRNFAHRFTRAG